MAQPIILDTDIGTDVDDCLALAVIMASPELELLAVTTVYGDTDLRAHMAAKLLSLGGRPSVPVAAGAREPLLGRPPVYWGGYEGQGLLGPDDAGERLPGEPAAALMTRLILARPGEITLVAIGPLTNVALALSQNLGLNDSLAGIVLMGGVVGGAYGQRAPWVEHRYSALGLPWTEHNFRSDPEAARIVLASGVPLTIVPLDVTSQVRMREADVARLRALGDPLHLAVADQVLRYPRFAARGWTNLHDPLTVATVIDPSLVHLEPLHVLVETGGEHSAGKLLVKLPSEREPATAQVALEVDVDRAERFILERLCRQ